MSFFLEEKKKKSNINSTQLDSSKPLFDNTDDIYCSVPMGFDLLRTSDPSLGLDEGTITFTKEEIQCEVFDPVIHRIIQLCKQLQKDTSNLKAIFTVGGFGSSAYLYQQLEKEFSPEGITIVQPDRPGKKRGGGQLPK